MNRFGDTLFRASPFIRWSLSPFLLAFILIFPFGVLSGGASALKVVIVAALEILALAVLLGLWATRRIGHMAFRLACLIVFSGYVAYLIAEIAETRAGKKLVISHSRAEPSPVNALMGLIVIGIPALRYAISGHLISQDESVSDSDEEPDEGE